MRSLLPCFFLLAGWFWLWLGFLPAGLGGSVTAAEPDPIQYSVTFAQADRHVVDVEAIIPAAGKETLELMMPVWTPGSYLVREYARNVETITASAVPSAEPLPLTKTAKNRWQIKLTGKPTSVRLRYRLYCREMSVRTNWVERDFGMLNGAATFITLRDDVRRPHRVRYVLPPTWSQAVCALPYADPETNDTDTENTFDTFDTFQTFVADSFDALVDSPVILGNPKIATFHVDGIEHQLVTINDDGLWDNQAAAEDVRRIVVAQRDFWGSLPYSRYLFLNVIGESRGGLEHDQSTLLMTSRWSYRDPQRYRSWLGLVSHELFHVWNVRRLRPRTLVTYDYERENHFDELWIAEGVTSYYDDLLQRRAGLLTEKDYLDRISKTLASVMDAPGHRVQPLRDASFDAWIKYYRPDENAVNARISYYTKGALVAWLLDAKIRESTGGKRSLDDVMRQLYSQHGSHAGKRRGYSSAEFRKIVDQVAGQPLSPFLEEAVDRTTPLDFTSALDWWGLQLGEPEQGEEPDTKDGQKDGDEQDESADDALAASATATAPETPYVGATVSEQAGRMIVATVLRGSPADRAGWNVDDELVALGGFRVTATLWKERLAQFATGEPIDCLLSRRGRLVERQIVLEPSRGEPWKLRQIKKPSDQQQQRRERWLSVLESSTP